MKFSIVLLLFLTSFLFSFETYSATCLELQNPDAQISDISEDPDFSYEVFFQNAQKNRKSLGFYKYTWNHTKFLCQQIEDLENRNFCLIQSAQILNASLRCLENLDSVKDYRPLTWSYLRNPEIQNLLRDALKKKSNSIQEKQLMDVFWNEFRILILPGRIQTAIGESLRWAPGDLEIMVEGLRKLKSSVRTAVGLQQQSLFQHLWGSGFLVVRIGEATIDGQLGEMYPTLPQQINIVVDLNVQKKGANFIAQHFAHEVSHSHDYLLGKTLSGADLSWSETDNAEIFKVCGLKADYHTSLFGCLAQHPTWFNFHPSNYTALRSAEFYTKMMDEWVRENLSLKRPGTYRCQNQQTESFWFEMEKNLIGEIVSSKCKTTN